MGRKNVQNKAKLFPPLEEPKRKSAFKIFVKINEPKMIKFKSLEKHEFRLI